MFGLFFFDCCLIFEAFLRQLWVVFGSSVLAGRDGSIRASRIHQSRNDTDNFIGNVPFPDLHMGMRNLEMWKITSLDTIRNDTNDYITTPLKGIGVRDMIFNFKRFPVIMAI